jgi:hypothetical protein
VTGSKNLHFITNQSYIEIQGDYSKYGYEDEIGFSLIHEGQKKKMNRKRLYLLKVIGIA